MESKIGIVKLSRKQLYDEIWLLSVAGVARKYNLNYSRLIGSCIEAGIPYPSSGYWTRKNMGKDVSSEIATLEGDENLLVELAANNSVTKRVKKVKPETNHIEKIPTEELLEEGLSAVEEDSNCNEKAVWENRAMETKKIPELPGVLEFLEQDERERVLSTAYLLEVNENVRLHRALVQYKKKISDYTARLKQAQKQTYYNPR